jgi:hypothetical protein
VSSDAAEFVIDSADATAGTASLRVTVHGASLVSLESPVFDTNKLRGLDTDGVKDYFNGIDGVERVDITFRPFWLKRMPVLVDHIEFKVVN